MSLLAPGVALPDNPGLSGVTYYLGELQPHGIVAASEDCGWYKFRRYLSPLTYIF